MLLHAKCKLISFAPRMQALCQLCTFGLSLHACRFMTTLELAVRFGKTLVVQEVDRIAPALLPLLRGDLNHRGSGSTVHIGDKVVDFNPGFKLVLVTRNPQPYLPAEAVSLLTVVNFTVTRSVL